MLPLSSISWPKILSLQPLLSVWLVEPPMLVCVLPPHSRSYSYVSLSLFFRVGSKPAFASEAPPPEVSEPPPSELLDPPATRAASSSAALPVGTRNAFQATSATVPSYV